MSERFNDHSAKIDYWRLPFDVYDFYKEKLNDWYISTEDKKYGSIILFAIGLFWVGGLIFAAYLLRINKHFYLCYIPLFQVPVSTILLYDYRNNTILWCVAQYCHLVSLMFFLLNIFGCLALWCMVIIGYTNTGNFVSFGFFLDPTTGARLFIFTWITIATATLVIYYILVIRNAYKRISGIQNVYTWRISVLIFLFILPTSLSFGTYILRREVAYMTSKEKDFSSLINLLPKKPELISKLQTNGKINIGTFNILIVERHIDDTFKLSEENCISGYTIPDSPNKIDIIVAVDKDTRVVRSYRPSGADYQWIYNVFVIKWPEIQLITSNVFYGSKPDDRSGSPAGFSTGHYGLPPWDEVERWLKKLNSRDTVHNY